MSADVEHVDDRWRLVGDLVGERMDVSHLSTNLPLRASWKVAMMLVSPKGKATTSGVFRVASCKSGSEGGRRWTRVSRADSAMERQSVSF